MTKVPLTFGPPDVTVERRADGAMIVRSPHPLGPYPKAMTDWLDHWARAAPTRVFLAERQGGAWRRVTYAEARDIARRIAQGIVDRGLTAERPVAILSGNSVEHALFGLGAMIAGVPYAPVSPPYSLVAKDYGKLKSILTILSPGPRLCRRRDAVRPRARSRRAEGRRGGRRRQSAEGLALDDIRGVHRQARRPRGRRGAGEGRSRHGRQASVHLRFDRRAQGRDQHPEDDDVEPGDAERRQPELWLGRPGAGRLASLEPHLRRQQQFQSRPVVRRLVLHRRGHGPCPARSRRRSATSRDVSPTIYYNVPKGFEMLLPYVQADAGLRKSLFAHLQSFVYAGAALAPHVREEFERLGRETVGHVVPILTSLGSTETGPSALSVTEKACEPGVVGIPNHGVELKLVPNGDKLEARLKSPSITPGYWRQPELTSGRLRRGGLLQARRRAAFRRRKRSRTRLPLRWPGGGGFQARDRHLGQRRAAQAQVYRPLRALCDGRGRRRPRPRRRGGPRRAERFGLPRACGSRQRRERRGRARRIRRCGRHSPPCSPPSTG